MNSEKPMDDKLLQATATITAALLQGTHLDKPLENRARMILPLFQLVYSQVQTAHSSYAIHNGKMSLSEHLEALGGTLKWQEEN